MPSEHLTYRYRLHGLCLASDLELPELALRSSSSDDEVDIRIVRGTLANGRQHASALQQPLRFANGSALFDIAEVGHFVVTEGREVVVHPAPGTEPSLIRLYLFGSIMGMICHQRGLLVLHASAVAFADQVLAFAGPQGAGKSTLAAHCLEQGGRLVADDMLVVSFAADGAIIAQPGMPGVKLWRHALDALDRNTEGLIRDWYREDKFHVPCNKAVVDASLPLTRIHILENDEQGDKGILTKLTGVAAVAALVANTFRLEYLDALGTRQTHFRDCCRLAAAVEVVRLSRRRDLTQLAETAGFVRPTLGNSV